jgi:hypothetical protein
MISKGVSSLVRHKSVDLKARALLADIDLLALRDLLPPSYTLEFNEQGRILNILRTDPPGIVAQPRFTRNEWYFLLTLFASYPYYAPYDILLANLTLLPVDECRKRIQQAQQTGSQELNRELKPVRGAVFGVQAKLGNSMPSLTVPCFRNTGYILTCSKTEDMPAER